MPCFPCLLSGTRGSFKLLVLHSLKWAVFCCLRIRNKKSLHSKTKTTLCSLKMKPDSVRVYIPNCESRPPSDPHCHKADVLSVWGFCLGLWGRLVCTIEVGSLGNILQRHGLDPGAGFYLTKPSPSSLSHCIYTRWTSNKAWLVPLSLLTPPVSPH